MSYEPKNTAARIIRGVPVFVEGLNANVEEAFDCADEYIGKLHEKGALPGASFKGCGWLRAIWFIKYRYAPHLLTRSDTLPEEALSGYWSDRIGDEVMPEFMAQVSY